MALPLLWRTTLFCGLGYGIPMGALLGLVLWDPIVWISTTIMGALLFGIPMGRITAELRKGSDLDLGGVPPVLAAGDVLVKKGLANHYNGLYSSGGRLLLTDRRLWFCTHALNLKIYEVSYSLDAIDRAEPFRSLGLIPNGLRVRLKDGRQERFVVERNREWTERIQQALARQGGGPLDQARPRGATSRLRRPACGGEPFSPSL